MLDLYGTNHDPFVFEKPYEFDPDRFKKMKLTPFNFIPRGVGDHLMDHRCPGELFTIELMRSVIEFFMFELSYEVPIQQLQIVMNRLPALPKSHLIIKNVQKLRPEILSEKTLFPQQGDLHP